MILSLLLVSINLIGCSTTETKTIYIPNEIPLRPRPTPVELYDVRFFVVTQENLNDFVNKFITQNGDLVFIAISIPDYELLSLNIAELRRYIEQQKSLILYYENNLKKKSEKK